jgi:hypothetical protein
MMHSSRSNSSSGAACGEDDNEGFAAAPAAEEETAYMFIIEGPRVLPWTQEPAARPGVLPCSTVHAALVKTQLRDGFPVLYSSGPAGTVALVQYLFDELSKGGLDLKPTVGDSSPPIFSPLFCSLAHRFTKEIRLHSVHRALCSCFIFKNWISTLLSTPFEVYFLVWGAHFRATAAGSRTPGF